jgi:hypothetical protein
MPASAIARIAPNVNVVPPRSGPSIRYQTSSINRNAKPTIAAVVRMRYLPSPWSAAGSVWSAADSSWSAADSAAGSSAAGAAESAAFHRLIDLATSATSTLISAAINSVRRLPNVSSMKNVEISVPATAPRVFIPYSSARFRRAVSESVSTARAAAGNVPPIASVGIANTSAARSKRTPVAAEIPSCTEPPIARYALRTSQRSGRDSAADNAMTNSKFA